MEVLVDKVYRGEKEDVVPFDVDLERGTVVYDVISGENKGCSKISALTTFKKKYKEL